MKHTTDDTHPSHIRKTSPELDGFCFAVACDRIDLPRGVIFRANILENFDPDAPVARWCQGFADGYALVHGEAESGGTCDHPERERLQSAAAVLQFFRSRETADQWCRGDYVFTDPSLAEGLTIWMAESFRETFVEALRDYAALGRRIRGLRRPGSGG